MITLFTDTYMQHQVIMSSSEYLAYKVQGIKMYKGLSSSDQYIIAAHVSISVLGFC